MTSPERSSASLRACLDDNIVVVEDDEWVDHWAYGGEEDLSGEIWLTWDQHNLYLAAPIQDNVHHQRKPGYTLWMGDSIQFSVSAGMSAEETAYELALPWDELAPIEADDGLLSLSIAVQDNDGLDRKCWISWSTKPIRHDPAP